MSAAIKRVGFVGIGNMGWPMAANLLAAGHAVRVWNRSPGRTDDLVAAGATAAASPRSRFSKTCTPVRRRSPHHLRGDRSEGGVTLPSST